MDRLWLSLYRGRYFAEKAGVKGRQSGRLSGVPQYRSLFRDRRYLSVLKQKNAGHLFIQRKEGGRAGARPAGNMDSEYGKVKIAMYRGSCYNNLNLATELFFGEKNNGRINGVTGFFKAGN